MTKQEIIDYFEYFNNSDPACDGIERFLSINGVDEVFERLKDSENLKLNKVRLNQLLLLSGLNNVTYGFFKYYWLEFQEKHPYNLKNLEFGYTVTDENGEEVIKKLGGYEIDRIEKYFAKKSNPDKESFNIEGKPFFEAIELEDNDENIINSIIHLRWGFLRIYTDALLYFGNINLGFTELNKKSYDELVSFFKNQSFDIDEIKERGECFKFHDIEQEDRYLISEAVCKNLDATKFTETALRTKLILRLEEAKKKGLSKVKIGALLDEQKKFKQLNNSKDLNNSKKEKELENKLELTMEDDVSTSDIINHEVSNENEIDEIIEKLYERFKEARNKALTNTKLYLSIINDLDVYVATSMRSKDDFITMAKNCFDIFHESEVKKLHLRYFDPTISAAEGHDDKGLIECLMVKCAKALIYTSGDKDSYGKDAEAAMALSSGKPVIFLCPDKKRYNISKNIHPLSKLIDFNSGVANGAMVTQNIQEVNTLLKRIFNNDMYYMLTKKSVTVFNAEGDEVTKSYFKLKDTLTASTVRVQTSDLFLTKGFWNYYTRYVKHRNNKK